MRYKSGGEVWEEPRGPQPGKDRAWGGMGTHIPSASPAGTVHPPPPAQQGGSCSPAPGKAPPAEGSSPGPGLHFRGPRICLPLALVLRILQVGKLRLGGATLGKRQGPAHPRLHRSAHVGEPVHPDPGAGVLHRDAAGGEGPAAHAHARCGPRGPRAPPGGRKWGALIPAPRDAAHDVGAPAQGLSGRGAGPAVSRPGARPGPAVLPRPPFPRPRTLARRPGPTRALAPPATRPGPLTWPRPPSRREEPTPWLHRGRRRRKPRDPRVSRRRRGTEWPGPPPTEMAERIRAGGRAEAEIKGLEAGGECRVFPERAERTPAGLAGWHFRKEPSAIGSVERSKFSSAGLGDGRTIPEMAE